MVVSWWDLTEKNATLRRFQYVLYILIILMIKKSRFLLSSTDLCLNSDSIEIVLRSFMGLFAW